jgi:hypothetical protein
MEHYDNIYDKIQELLGTIPGNVSILEQQIDADVQLEYYNFARKVENSFNREEVLKNRDTIFNNNLKLDDKKHLLIQLANIDSIEAYRTLERYSNDSRDPLKDWAMLALQECKLLLESKLLDESQILISTGLGGKGLKLRYFTVLIAANGDQFSEFERKVITDEIGFAIRKSKGEIEKLRFNKELCIIISIIPLQVPIQALFDDLIRECNQLGSFINKDYIITNVKILPIFEIRELIGNSRHKNKTRKE